MSWNVKENGELTKLASLGEGSGSSNYENLSNKPSINDITLEGNMTYSDLELMSNTNPTASGTFDLDGDIIASGRITDGDGNSLSNLNGLVFLVNSSGILEITYDDGGE